MNRKNAVFFLIVLLPVLCSCSDEQNQQGLGEPYVVDLTTLPTTGEGTLTLKPADSTQELSGVFQVGPYSIDIRVDSEIARAAGINIKKPFEDKVKVIISRHHKESSGFHQIYELGAIEIL